MDCDDGQIAQLSLCSKRLNYSVRRCPVRQAALSVSKCVRRIRRGREWNWDWPESTLVFRAWAPKLTVRQTPSKWLFKLMILFAVFGNLAKCERQLIGLRTINSYSGWTLCHQWRQIAERGKVGTIESLNLRISNCPIINGGRCSTGSVRSAVRRF